MKLFIDNNDGRGRQDYTAFVDSGQLPRIARSLNRAATLAAVLAAADATFQPPVKGARIILERNDGLRLFTGYLDAAPERQYLGQAQQTVWRYLLYAVDDSCLLDQNALPARTAFVSRTAGSALKTLTDDVLPGVLDESGVQDVSPINQFTILPQRNWTDHAQQLSTMARAAYRAHDGKLTFQPVGQTSFAISEQDTGFMAAGLRVAQSETLRNDVTIVGELEPLVYVRDYFLGNGTTLAFYLSKQPYSASSATIFQEDYTATKLAPARWLVSDVNHKVSLSGGQLQLSGGPVTISLVEPVELAGGVLIQHGKFTFTGASSGIVGGLYNSGISQVNCIAGFNITPSGSNCSIQAIVNGSATGPTLTTTAGHRYALSTQLFCSEAHRVHQTYLSSTHPGGEGRGGDSIAAAVRVVLMVHDVDPTDPGTLAAPGTVLYDNVVSTTPSFAVYALVSAGSFLAKVSFTRLQRIVDAEIRSAIPGGQFRTRMAGAFADGGECYLTSTGVLEFYPPYPPEPNEQVVVAYRSSGHATARVQDANSIAQHANGSDQGQRILVRHLGLPVAPTSIDCENAASAFLDDSVQTAWEGEYQATTEALPGIDAIPGEAVQVLATSLGAEFDAIVRQVDIQVLSLAEDRSQYTIKFANDAAQPLGFEFENVTLSALPETIYDIDTPSSTKYIASLTAAQVTNVIATEITVDAGLTPPNGGGIEVRRSDGGWGASDSGNLAGRFTTRTFTLPRLSRVQGYYLRQYDGSTPAKYSRYSALLHVDYPL